MPESGVRVPECKFRPGALMIWDKLLNHSASLSSSVKWDCDHHNACYIHGVVLDMKWTNTYKTLSVWKIVGTTLPTKVRLVKAMVFPVVMYGCESWTVKTAECRRTDAFELWC